MGNVAVIDADAFAQKVEQDQELTLVDFYADWCGPCKMIAPVLEQLSETYGDKINIVKLDADKHPEVLAKYGVRGLPTLMIFKDGAPHATKVGAQPKSAIEEFVKEAI